MKILNQYTTFNQLIGLINTISPNCMAVHSHAGGKHIGCGFRSHMFPLSINEQEFNYLHDVIIANQLTNGFELATGTGISTIAIGAGMKKTGGHLITLDSYFEAASQLSTGLIPDPSIDHKVVQESYDYITIAKLLKEFELSDFIDQETGWSPTDSIRLLSAYNRPIDFAFLDCPKGVEEIKRDVSILKDFVNKDKFVIFIHDINSDEARDEVNKMLHELCGWKVEPIGEYFKGTPNHAKVFFPIHVINHNCILE